MMQIENWRYLDWTPSNQSPVGDCARRPTNAGLGWSIS
jgi:hypothetical protein